MWLIEEDLIKEEVEDVTIMEEEVSNLDSVNFKRKIARTVISRRGARLCSNPVDADGNQLRCYICDSTRHLANRCPHADEERNGQVHVAQFPTHSSVTSYPHSGSRNEGDRIHLTLYNSKSDETLSSVVGETLAMAVLDSACTKTVAGESWTNARMHILNLVMGMILYQIKQ